MSELTRRQVLGQIATGTAAVIGLGTGGWLAAGTGAAVACVRPPGALLEEDFLATCIRCGRCADACPNRCIVAFTEGISYDIQRAGNLKSMFFGGEGLFLATLRGHGTVILQSLPFSRLAERVVRSAGGFGAKGESSALGTLNTLLGD